MGLGSIANIGLGLSEYYEGQAMIDELEARGRPKYEIPEEIEQNLSQAQRMALEGLPEASKKMFVEEIQRAGVTAFARQDERGGGGAVELYQAQVDASKQLLSADIQQRQANVGRLFQQRGMMAGQKAQQWQINELDPYEQELALAWGLRFRGEDMWRHGMQQQNEDIESMMGMMTGAGAMGGGGGSSQAPASMPVGQPVPQGGTPVNQNTYYNPYMNADPYANPYGGGMYA